MAESNNLLYVRFWIDAFWLFSVTELKAFTGGLISTLPVQSTEWQLSFKLKVNTFAHLKWKKILVIENQLLKIPIPKVSMLDTTLQISTQINEDETHKYKKDDMILNKFYEIAISQRYIANGEYLFRIMIDGIEVHSVINRDAIQYFNQELYVLKPTAADCDITDLSFTNFL